MLALGATGLEGGCAWVTAQPVRPGERVNGIPIHAAKPLLIVTGSEYKIEYVPNTSRTYALRFGAFLAKNNFKGTITGGMLTDVSADMDSTAAIQLLKDLVAKLPAISGAQTFAQNAGGVQVYEFVFDDAGNLVELRQVL